MILCAYFFYNFIGFQINHYAYGFLAFPGELIKASASLVDERRILKTFDLQCTAVKRGEVSQANNFL